MSGTTLVIRGQAQRDMLAKYARTVPINTVFRIMPEGRSLSQNDKLWAVLTEVSNQKPRGLDYTPEAWKSIFMSHFGIETRYLEGLNGEPVPLGFSTSRLSKKQMSEFLEMIHAWAAQNGVELSQ